MANVRERGTAYRSDYGEKLNSVTNGDGIREGKVAPEVMIRAM
jgi:hypothetical protein